MVLVVFKTSFVWKPHRLEQLALFISAPKMNPKQIIVFKLRGVSRYIFYDTAVTGRRLIICQWEDWRDIPLTGFCPALMSPMLIVMSLISTPVAANEWHSGVSTAQLGPGPADSDLAANSHSLVLNRCAFQHKLLCVIQYMCSDGLKSFLRQSGVNALIIEGLI